MNVLLRDDRLFPEIGGDDRSSFARDRDRILYCAQFRRLSGVTQVTSPLELHTFHNRLTHSLEVAQIARRTAERLLKRKGAKDYRELLDADVCEAAALAHDLGHPPFGHNGETVLDQLAQETGRNSGGHEKDGYEGNAQSLRILTKLAKRTHEHDGLNLTVATLRASIKYPWVRAASGSKHKKFGAFQTEKEELDKLFDGMPAEEQTLEAQIMDWADDVAFSVHDLYDFILAGVIPLSWVSTVDASHLKELLAGDEKARSAADDAYSNVAQFLNRIPNVDVRVASRFSSSLVAHLKAWVSTQITRFTDLGLSVVLTGSNPHMSFGVNMEDEVAILKGLTKHFVISSPALGVRQAGEEAVLRSLYSILLDDANKAHSRLLSAESKERISDSVSKPRVVLDVISSMTDAQALALHQKLTGQTVASILDMTTPSLF